MSDSHIKGFCDNECRHRIVAKGYIAPNSDAINIYAQQGTISEDLINLIDHELNTADREIVTIGRNVASRRANELRAMRHELLQLRRHVIRVNARAALGAMEY